MMHRVLAALLIVAPVVGAQQPAVRPPVPVGAGAVLSDSAIRAIIEKRVADKGTMGIAVGVIGADGRTRIFTAGSSGTPRPIDANTMFEIGSITKVFTGAVLADMVATGDVSLDDPVAKHLPAPAKVPTRNGREITLLDLVTQSSGLPRMPANFTPKDPSNPYADYSERQAIDFLATYELPRDVGSTYEYSNFGMGLLGIALAHRAGTSYEEVVRRRVLDPLGMDDTRIALTPSMRDRLALGHDPAGGVTANWDITGLAGAGALRSTMTDMLEFLAANLDSTSAPLGRTLSMTHAPRHGTQAPNMAIGFAWHILTTPFGGKIVWHNGGTGGYRSFIGFDPERRVGVVVLTNAATSPDDIGFHLVEPRLPLRPPASPQGNRKEISLAAAILRQYVGEYELSPTFRIAVTLENGALFGQPTSQPKVQMFAEKKDEFFLKVVDAQVRFTRDAAGQVTGLVLMQGGRSTPGSKIR